MRNFSNDAFIEAEANNFQEFKLNVDQFFMTMMAIFIFFMHAGFAFLETGSVRSKNVTNSIMKNVVDLFVGALAFWMTGFAFEYGQPGNAFIGHNHFFACNVKPSKTTYYMEARYTRQKLGKFDWGVSNTKQQADVLAPSHFYAYWFFEYVFAASATTIASGAMAERVEFSSYMIYCFVMTGFIYPVSAHWCWSGIGWLKTGIGTGLSFKDFAGSAVVHVVGGTSAFVGATILGPRIGRFNPDGSSEDYPGHSVTITALGGYILFAGFLAFNGGSELTLFAPGSGVIVAMAVMNTIIGGAAAAMTAMVTFKTVDFLRGDQHYWSLLMAINGGLAGMVSMCATCNDLYPWAAGFVGAVAGISLVGWHNFIIHLKIDDPLDAVAVHFGGGFTGILLGPIFAVNGLKVDGKYVGGVIYGGNRWAYKNFAWNLLGTITIITWTATMTALLFGTMRFFGILRVSEETEIHGSDTVKHNEPAYPTKSYTEGLYLLGWKREQDVASTSKD